MVDARELMRLYCEGDERAFRELYAHVAPSLLSYLLRLTRRRALADDLLQQTFLKVHRARRAYVRNADPIPWMYAIAYRTFVDEMRRERRRTPPPRDPAPHGEAPADDPALAHVIGEALAQLPPRQREAVVLVKLEGLSFAEAAELAGTTVGAMKVRAHRGYEALRAAFDDRTRARK